MKKNLLILFAALLIFQNGLTMAATNETTTIFSTLKNAIIKDVQDTVNSTVSTAATKAMNAVKLAQYKSQLAQKQEELKELEASDINFFSKFFKRIKLNREIRNLEYKIQELEK